MGTNLKIPVQFRVAPELNSKLNQNCPETASLNIPFWDKGGEHPRKVK